MGTHKGNVDNCARGFLSLNFSLAKENVISTYPLEPGFPSSFGGFTFHPKHRFPAFFNGVEPIAQPFMLIPKCMFDNLFLDAN